VTVTPDKIRAYIAQRQEPRRNKKGEPLAPISNAKVNRETEILGRAFHLAVEEGRLSHNPKIPTLPERNVRQGFFEKAEFQAITALLPGEIADLAWFGYLTGWRLSEITGLRWENVDRAAKELRIYDSKNGDGRVIPLAGQLLALIEKRWAARQFSDWRGEPGVAAFVFHRQGNRIGNFRGKWNRAAEKAKIPGKLFHDLRRTAVRDMIRAGVPQAVAQTISGHRTGAVFSRYNITSAEDKIEALRRRESYLESRDSKPKVVPLKAVNSDTDSDTAEEK
jgi:integrase